MMNKKETIKTAAILLVAIIAIVFGVRSRTTAPEVEVPEPLPVVEETALEVTAPPATLSYAEAVEAYTAKRFIIDDACAITPDVQTFAPQVFPVGTRVMFDNQGTTTRTIEVNGNAYTIGSRKYRTALLDTAGAITVSCDDIEEAYTITVE